MLGGDIINTLKRKKTVVGKEIEEERPMFQTLFIVGCLYNTAKKTQIFKFEIFEIFEILKILESTTQFKVWRLIFSFLFLC